MRGRTRFGSRRAAAVLAIVVSGATCGGCATTDRDDLASFVGQLHSAAAEGVLLAGQARHHHDPKVFTWLESAELLHQVETVAEHLDGQTVAAGAAAAMPVARQLAEALRHEFIVLHNEPASPIAAAQVEAACRGAAERSEKLEKELA